MMLWIIAIILIFISILVLSLLSWLYYKSPDIYPTIHSPCHDNSLCDGVFCVRNCGGDLICDPVCHRCKKKLGGVCSSTVDCETGLICSNWICVSDDGVEDDLSDPSFSISSPNQKHVRWTDHNEIFPIPSRIHFKRN